MEKRIYRPLPEFDFEQAKEILTNGTWEQLMYLPLSVGTYWDEWRPAQDVCTKLLVNENAAVRANAALGLAYIARTMGKLDKRIVKPYLLKELRENSEYQWRIIDAIEDINIYLKWGLAEKALEKIRSEHNEGYPE